MCWVVDRSPEMIRQARLEISVAAVRKSWTLAKSRWTETLTPSFSNATLHWIKEPRQVIAGIKKSLRPGGRFVAEFGGKGILLNFSRPFQHAWQKLGLTGPAPHPWYYPSLAEYAGLLEEYGFEVTHATLFDRPTPLDDGERGLRNWLEMFGSALVEACRQPPASACWPKSNENCGQSSSATTNGLWITAASGLWQGA